MLLSRWVCFEFHYGFSHVADTMLRGSAGIQAGWDVHFPGALPPY